MAKKFPLIFILASNLFLTGVLSVSILTIENRCNDTVWPAIYSKLLVSSGFALKPGESRVIDAPSLWSGRIWGRTLCSNDSTGNFSCVTGDCESKEIECPRTTYHWSPVTYIDFTINYGGTNTYTISLERGYNLPLMVAPSNSRGTCISSGCALDLNTCPDDLKTLFEGYPVSCSSECQRDETDENCCANNFESKQNCTKTMHRQNFERACPLAYVYPFSENNSIIVCPNSTDYVITFCPSSIPENKIRSSKPPRAEAKDDSLRKLKLIAGALVALAVVIIIVATTLIVRKMITRRKRDSNLNSVEAAVMLKGYSYKGVEKMTNSFAHIIGKGGFGTVYKGKLPDSVNQDIAVKILDETKGNGNDFINELYCMSRASHVNIVSLFGFCCEGSKRAIISEYMPNGSLDKFMFENMEWETLYNIAVGIARGLEYLHNSCVSKIVHLDIKPQNILMDQDFCPKISDFGLAKLWKNKESIISMSKARGTAGYIAPEMFLTSNGGVSHKSDVYSYGMVVLEMIGATKKERFISSRSNPKSMYFPDWIYEDLEKRETVRLLEDHITEEEEKIVKKTTLVGLWCIKTNPSDRPRMRKVVEMLEGNLEAIEVPPKPPLKLPVVTVWEAAEDSQETSSLWTPS